MVAALDSAVGVGILCLRRGQLDLMLFCRRLFHQISHRKLVAMQQRVEKGLIIRYHDVFGSDWRVRDLRWIAVAALRPVLG